MAFSDARTNAPEPQVRVQQNAAPADVTTGAGIAAFGTIGGEVRRGQVEGNLQENLGVSGNIIATLNSPDTVELQGPTQDGVPFFDLSVSDPTGSIDTTSEEFKRIAVGLDQGKISDERAAIEAEVVLRKSIARAPGFATQLRQLAKDTLGFNASGAALEALFLSGPTANTTTLTLAQKDDAAAAQFVKTGEAPNHAVGLQMVVGARAQAAKKANELNNIQLSKFNAPRVAVAASEQAQFLMNDVMLQGIAQIRTNEAVANVDELTNGLRAARDLTTSEVHDAMASDPNNRFDQAAYDAVTDGVERTFQANKSFLEQQDILKVLTRRQDLLQVVLGIEAINASEELALMAQFGERAVEDYLELMAASQGDPQLMEKFMKQNPAFGFVGRIALDARAIGPTLRAISNGNLGAAVDSGSIPTDTARGVLKFNSLRHIEGLADPGEFDNNITSLLDLDLKDMAMSTAAQTRNSFNITSPENRVSIARQFAVGQAQVAGDIGQLVTNTPFLLGWDPAKQQFAIERRDEDPTALTDAQLQEQFGGAAGTPPTAAQLERIASTPRAPGFFAEDQIAVLNESLLPLIRDARWANQFGEIDPNQWANNLIVDANTFAINNELETAGDLTSEGSISAMTISQQVRVRNALQTGDQQAVFDVLEEMGAGAFAQTAEGQVGSPLERVGAGDQFLNPVTGEVVTFGPDGRIESKLAGSGVIGRPGGENPSGEATPGGLFRKGIVTPEEPGVLGEDFPRINTKADPDIVTKAKEAARDIGIREALFLALIQAESNFDPEAQPKDAEGNLLSSAKGLTQLLDGTAAELGVEDSFDVDENLSGGATYLKQQLDAFKGSEASALAAYHAGPGALRKAKGDIKSLPQETQEYVKRVLDLAGPAE